MWRRHSCLRVAAGDTSSRSHQNGRRFAPRADKSVCATSFRIPHSAFRIAHSAFRIAHSAFRVPRYFAFFIRARNASCLSNPVSRSSRISIPFPSTKTIVGTPMIP